MKNKFYKAKLSGLITAWILSLLPLVSFAEWTPLPQEQAFKSIIKMKDANTVLAEWYPADGYYLYRNKIKFTSNTSGITIGEVTLPKGKVKEDPAFGKVEVFYKKVSIEVPIKRTDTSLTSFELIAESQGCADKGLCYPPHKETVKLTLAAAGSGAAPAVAGDKPAAPASNDKSTGIEGLKKLGNDVNPQQDSGTPLPADQAFKVVLSKVDANTFKAVWQIEKGYYVYKNRFKFKLKGTAKDSNLGTVQLPKGKMKQDPAFGKVEVFYNTVSATIPVKGDLGKNPQIELTYQGCADIGLCYPPEYKTFNMLTLAAVKGDSGTNWAAVTGGNKTGSNTTGTTTNTDPAKTGTPATTTGNNNRDAMIGNLKGQSAVTDFLIKVLSGSDWTGFIWFIVMGLFIAGTACMYPMIPIVCAIVLGQDTEKASAFRGFMLSLTYVLGMAVVFAILGGLMGAAGAASVWGDDLVLYFQKPVFLFTSAALLVLLSLSMFGFYNIQMPASLQSKLTEYSGKQKGGTYIGVFIMGALSSLIIGPCGGPIVLLAIAFAYLSKSILVGALFMALVAIGVGLPLIAVGTCGGAIMPRAGNWMNTLKSAAGVILIFVALYLLEGAAITLNFVKLYMVIWAFFFVIVGVYMGAFDRIEAGVSGWRRLFKGLGIMSVLWGALVLLGGVTGGKFWNDPFTNSALFSNVGSSSGSATSKVAIADPKKAQLYAGKTTKQKGLLNFIKVKTPEDLQREIKAANQAGYSVMLDFYADWCTYCTQFDYYVFNKPKVRDALKNTVLLYADITKMDDKDKALLASVKVTRPPAILFFTPQGKESGKRVYAFMKHEPFLERIKGAFGN